MTDRDELPPGEGGQEQTSNGEGAGFQDKWMRGEEDETDSNERAEVARQTAQTSGGTAGQAGEGGLRNSSAGTAGSDDERFRHQERGGKNPGDSFDTRERDHDGG